MQIRKIINLIRILLQPMVDIKPRGLSAYYFFWKDYFTYRSLPEAERVRFGDLRPILSDKTQLTSIDGHYFYQGIWAARKIIQSGAMEHVDIGSQKDLVGFLTILKKIKFIDIRPLATELENLENIKGDILNLPLANDSVASISCLHVAEHIGLGRYGDPLDPQGTKGACLELSRVLAGGGNLYFSLPVGDQRVCFNAHRVHYPRTIVDYFSKLKLVELSGVGDKGNFVKNVPLDYFDQSKYACGFFHFTKC